MAMVRQPYGEERFVPWIGRLVQPGEIVEVSDVDLAAYLAAGWQQEKAKGGKPASEEQAR